MLSKLSLIVLVPFVSALITIDTPNNLVSGESATITWTQSAPTTDPTFSIELINSVFNDAFAIANNVDPSLGTLSLQLPIVPSGGGYTIQFVNVGDIKDVFAVTSGFSIGATPNSNQGGSVSSTLTVTSPTRTTSIPKTTGVEPVVTPNVTSNSTPMVSTLTDTSSTNDAISFSFSTITSATAKPTHSSSAVSSRFALTNAGNYAILFLSTVAGIAVLY